MNKLSPAASLARAGLAALSLSLSVSLAAQAQSSCSSDGQPPPTALLERFINADCDACWSDPQAPEPASGSVAVDWISPGGRGDDAPLSAGATRDTGERLQARGKEVPDKAASSFSRLVQPRKLRVAHGLAFNDYIGTSIELQNGGRGPWRAWLVLVETVPAGEEGTAVERNLVRNALQVEWNADARKLPGRLLESRAMRIPEGALPERLRVIGWVEDARGQVRGIAQSRCAPPRRKG